MRRAILTVLLCLALAACHPRGGPAARVGRVATATSTVPPPMAVTLAPQINAVDFLRYDETLASRAFAGRKPDTRGEVLTTHYLIAQLKRMHLAPGYRGGWLQPVPVVATQLLNTGVRLQVSLPGGVQSFAYGTDMLAAT